MNECLILQIHLLDKMQAFVCLMLCRLQADTCVELMILCHLKAGVSVRHPIRAGWPLDDLGALLDSLPLTVLQNLVLLCDLSSLIELFLLRPVQLEGEVKAALISCCFLMEQIFSLGLRWCSHQQDHGCVPSSCTGQKSLSFQFKHTKKPQHKLLLH